MEMFIYIFLALAILYLLKRHLKSNNEIGAIFNVLLAKYTFSTLDALDQKRVQDRTASILDQAMDGRFKEFNGELDQYGWYALAMRELGIPPAADYSGWNIVKNPFLAVLPNNPKIDGVRAYIKKTFDIDVEISQSHKLFDSLHKE